MDHVLACSWVRGAFDTSQSLMVHDEQCLSVTALDHKHKMELSSDRVPFLTGLTTPDTMTGVCFSCSQIVFKTATKKERKKEVYQVLDGERRQLVKPFTHTCANCTVHTSTYCTVHNTSMYCTVHTSTVSTSTPAAARQLQGLQQIVYHVLTHCGCVQMDASLYQTPTMWTFTLLRRGCLCSL